MAQKIFYNTNLQSMRASNIGLQTYAIYELIVLDNISVNGITHFGLEIKNNSNVGNVTNVSIYASPNSVDYFPIENNIYQANIGPATIKHVEFTTITGFLRITVQVDADVNIDVYLHGNIV